MEILKQLRKEYGYTQAELARKICMEQNNYSKYERGEREIGRKTIIKLCKVYNISADYLLGLTDEKRPLNKEQ